MTVETRTGNANLHGWDVLKACLRSWRIYAVAVVLALLLALLVGTSIPDVYTAEVKVVDENTEMDIAVGKDPVTAYLPQDPLIDKGINDPEIYGQLIETPQFRQAMAAVRIEQYGQDYYHYLVEHVREPWWTAVARWFSPQSGDERVDRIIRERIRYKMSEKYQTLLLQATDQHPEVAVVLVEAMYQLLQQHVWEHKQHFMSSLLSNTESARNQDLADYHAAQQNYVQHLNRYGEANRMAESATTLTLKQEMDDAFGRYNKANEQFYHYKARLQSAMQPFTILQDVTTPHKPSAQHVVLLAFAFGFIAVVMATWYVLFRLQRAQPMSSVRATWRRTLFDPFSPWAITIAVWVAILVLFQFQQKLLYPLSEQFYQCLFLWLLTFIPASLLSYYLLPGTHREGPQRDFDVKVSQPVFNFLLAISIIITPMYFYQVLQVVSMFDASDLLYNIRILAVYGNERHGFLSYSYILNQVLLVSALWQYPKIAKWKLFFAYAATCMSAFAIMEKGLLFFLMLCTVFVLYQKGKIKMRTISLSAVGIILLFFLLNVLRGGSLSDLGESDATLLDFFAMYILSPAVAFGKVTQDITTQVGSHTFQVFYQLFNQWGLGDFEVNVKTQEFVYVPIPTNVFTIFQPFYQDFAYTGVAFFGFVYGTVSGLLFRLYHNGNGFCRCLYTYMVYVLVLQFYQENIFMSIVMFMQFVFFTFLIQQQSVGFNLKFRK